MIALRLYKLLLRLYPADFRAQFAAEMLCVFTQRAGERFANGKTGSVAFLISEFSGVLKGAYTMRTRTVVPISTTQPTPHVNESSLTAVQLSGRRSEAVQRMVAALSEHDFVNARRYSEEETRLTARLKEMGAPSERLRTA